ncbi:hypothetical protein VHEMI06802 [[Torrubiella] hemipterigena]|uniref:Uncharacterized protein n=1 Tax=[Torrubiella] hemipterigena TaxID=1531966 RepID=A0A0A1T8E4_9HYPO|nr:hypothetical protein VHEMI06802 [[Torrubiella] hemipterigena]
MPSATVSSYTPLVTEQPNGYDGRNQGQSGTEAGASGDSSANSISLSTGGMIAIIVVVVIVAIIGAVTATLFFIAKKREWTIKETIRRSAAKVKRVMTPKRTEFPDSVKRQMGGSTGRRDRRPSTSRSSADDVEKAWPLPADKKQSRR